MPPLALALARVVSAGCNETQSCDGFDEGTAGDLFVLDRCGDDSNDGTVFKPFGSLSHAVAAAQPGETIGGGGVALRSTAIVANAGAAVLADGTGAVSIIDPAFAPSSAVVGTRGGPQGSDKTEGVIGADTGGGDGVVIEGGAEGDKGAADAGSGASLVIDGGTVVAANQRGGVVATNAKAGFSSMVAHSGRGGVWASGPQSSVQLGADTRVTGSAVVGVLVENGAKLNADGAEISATRKGSGGEGGHGVVVVDTGRAWRVRYSGIHP